MTPATTFLLISAVSFAALWPVNRFGPAAADVLTPICAVVGTGTAVIAALLFAGSPG